MVVPPRLFRLPKRPLTQERSRHKRLPTGVFGVGGASFFSDSSHEMVTSLLPSFVATTLHAGPGALGVIDGVADMLTGLSKLVGGPLASDPRRRLRLASSGYVGTAIATSAIALTVAVWQTAALRTIAWVSRGLRSPARDMVLTDLVPAPSYGRAFGVERAGDNAGALAGPLLAALLVSVIGLRWSIACSIIPGLCAALAITLAGRQVRHVVHDPGQRRTLGLRLRELHDAGIARTLMPTAAFECGNLAATLLILRASGLLETHGRDHAGAASLAILLYAGHNAVASVAALAAGALIDRTSPPLLLAIGGACYIASYCVFASTSHGVTAVAVGFVLAGCGIGAAETAESSLVAASLPGKLRSQGLGLLGLVQAFGDLAATVVAGALWARLGPTTAFTYAAAWMLLSLVLWPLSTSWKPRTHKEAGPTP